MFQVLQVFITLLSDYIFVVRYLGVVGWILEPIAYRRRVELVLSLLCNACIHCQLNFELEVTKPPLFLPRWALL